MSEPFFSRTTRLNRPSSDVNMRRSTTLTEESNEGRSSSNVEKREGKEIKVGSGTQSVDFLGEAGNHIVSGSDDGKIRCWRVEDGREVGTPIDVGDKVSSLAVSQDGEWIVVGTRHKIIVYLQSGKKVNEFQDPISESLEVMDISLDGTKIAINIHSTRGRRRSTSIILWSPSTDGQLPLGDENIELVKFSRDSRLIATSSGKIRIHDSENSYILQRADISRPSAYALAWSSDNKQLFAWSENKIRCFDISSKNTLFEWTAPGSPPGLFDNVALRLSIPSINTFLPYCVNGLLSFCNARSHQQIGPTIQLPWYTAQSMAVSAKHNLMIFGYDRIIMYNLREILPSNVLEDDVLPTGKPLVPRRESIPSLRTQNDRPKDRRSVLELTRNPNASVGRMDDTPNETIDPLRRDLRTDEMARAAPSDRKTLADQKKTIQQLRTQLADSARTAREKEDSLQKTIQALHEDIAVHSATQRSSDEEIADLEKTTQQLRTQLRNSKRSAREEEDALNETITALRAVLVIQNTRSNEKIRDMEATIEQLGNKLVNLQQNAEGSLKKLRIELADSEQRADRLTKILHVQCEALYTDGHVIHGAKMLLGITKFMADNVRSNMVTMDWLPALTNKYIVELERIGDGAPGTDKHDEAVTAYAAALSLSPSTPNTLLTKWMGIMLLHGSTKDVINSAKKFMLPSVVIDQTICDALERHGCITEAIEYFQQIQSDLTSVRIERTEWELDFLRRCAQKLKDVELSPENCNEVIQLLSTILSFDSSDQVDILIKRSKARVVMESWKDALGDADEVINLDPSSPLGYEQRRAARHGMKHYAEAVAAFDTALKLRESSDERIRERCPQYTDARPRIRDVIHETTLDMPLELIDTETGDLLDRSKQKEAFEADSIFNELVSSMATEIDAARIEREVMKFYRYVMLSHRWQHLEPLYKDVKNTKVFKLESFAKLKAFCELACSLKFRWAWCDTCCIDQGDGAVLHESLVSMFTWYRGSTLTIVYLHDSPSKRLWESEWNRRAWTYQEYVASKVIQFYTKDWKRYLDLEGNHKESSTIIAEMKEASRASAEQMAVLRPGRDRVREKLFLASRRQSTRVEDVAYSLLGIFDIDIDIKYGERTRAVGRFLENVLKGSYDSITILAWTGTPNPYNSCLPSNLTVYDSLEPPHIPHMETTRLNEEVLKVTSDDDVKQIVEVLDRLTSVSESVPAAGVLSLQCISCPISELVPASRFATKTTGQVYDATTTLFGKVEIKTASVLNDEVEYHVVHPWIHALRGPYSPTSAGLEKEKTARRLIVLLRQPFGALLLHRESWESYKRVAADCLIRAQISKPLSVVVRHINRFSVR